MFENVPEKLTVYVRDHISQFVQGTDRSQLYLAAAGGVIQQYLNSNAFSPEADAFLNASRVNASGLLWYGYMLRVILIGETLFRLRSCPGFPEICRRLKSRSLRPAYFEMLAAQLFFRAGFEIHARPETMIKTEDFDFSAKDNEGHTINVEVTALEQKEFNATTAINRLGKKRRQLPKTAPSIIFCVLPEEWESAGIDLNTWTEAVANKFLSNTSRVNAIVFEVERHIDMSDDGSTGGFVFITKPFANLNPRFHYDLNFLFKDTGDSGRRYLLEKAGPPDDLLAAAQALREGEFFEWVDYLVPPSSASAAQNST